MAIKLSVSLLGGFSGALDAKPLSGFESGKVRALLAYLMISPEHPHSRDELADLLWPDFPNDVARKNLRQALNNLRHVLHDHQTASPFILTTPDSIQLNPESPYQLDVTEFRNLLNVCEKHPHRRVDACHSCTRRREQAVDLYQGDFLEHFFVSGSDPFENWAVAQRESLRQSLLASLTQLCAYYERVGDYENSRQYATRQLAFEPWNEEAHRYVMRSLAASGQRNAALAQYHACYRILQAELEIEPERATQTLYHQIANGDFQVPNQSAEVTSSNLPGARMRLVGRAHEIDNLIDLLERVDCRLVTLTGPGGVGKTSLALELARSLQNSFSDGIYYVPLSSIESIDLIIPTVAEKLNLPLVGATDPFIQLQRYLADRDLLLILDNFDHLLAGSGMIIDLLQNAPDLVFLITSRERLRIADEWVVEVKGLPVLVDSCDGDDACDLFVRLAHRSKSDFSSTGENYTRIAGICQLVEGLPLAIELAAGWVRFLSLNEIATEIEQGLNILADNQWDDVGRPGLRAVFSRSVDLLSPVDRQAFNRMAVFRGGFDRQAARTIADAPIEIIAALIDKSLIRLDERGRYDMHTLIRQFSEEQLAFAGELAVIKDMHLDYFLNLACLAEEHLLGSADQDQWMKMLQDDHHNLQAAIQWAFETDQVELSAQLVSALWRYWHLSGRLSEGRNWINNILTHEIKLSPKSQARVHFAEGILSWYQGMYSQARTHLERSVTLWQSLGDQRALAYALTMLGFVLDYYEEYTSARPYLEKSVELFESLGDPWGYALSLYNRGYVRAMAREVGAQADLDESLKKFRSLNDAWGIALPLYGLGYWMLIQEMFAAAKAQLETSLAARRQLGDQWLIGQNLNYLGEVARCLGDYQQAEQCYQESLSIFEELGSQGRVAMSIHNLGYVALNQGDSLLAQKRFQQAYVLFQLLEDHYGTAACLEGLAAVIAKENEPEASVKLLIEAQNIRGTLSFTTTPADRREYAHTCAIVRGQLGEQGWLTAWQNGARLRDEVTITNKE